MAPVRVVPAALYLEWELFKGDSFDLALPVLDKLNASVDVTGWTAKSQIRRSELEPVLHEWSTAAANIEVAGTDVVLIVDGTVTREWGFVTAQISVEATDLDGKPHTIAYGTVRALPEITQ